MRELKSSCGGLQLLRDGHPAGRTSRVSWVLITTLHKLAGAAPCSSLFSPPGTSGAHKFPLLRQWWGETQAALSSHIFMCFLNSQVWSQTGQIEKKVFVTPNFLSAQESGNGFFHCQVWKHLRDWAFESTVSNGHSSTAIDLEFLRNGIRYFYKKRNKDNKAI